VLEVPVDDVGSLGTVVVLLEVDEVVEVTLLEGVVELVYVFEEDVIGPAERERETW